MEQRSNFQRQSRKMALCGMMAALSVVILCLGGLIPLATFACPMLAMYVLVLYLFRLEAVVEEFAEYSTAMVVGLLAMGNATFLVFDQVLARLTALYQKKRKA